MRLPVAALGILGILLLLPSPAAAASNQGKHEIGAYIGGMFGDDLTDATVSGDQPELDDDVTFGLRYGYNFTKSWGLDVSAGFTPGAAIGIATVSGGETDMDLFTVDVDAVWTYSPDARAKGYVLFGVGFASADLDEPIIGTVGAASVEIDDDSGFTLNAGAGVKFPVTAHFLIRAEARYRFIDAVVDNFDDSLSTFETTVGAGWTF